MKNLVTLAFFLFVSLRLFAQTECVVKIVYSMNKSLPPSYTFKTDPATTGAKYYWSFGDNTVSDSPMPTHTFKATGNYAIQVKVAGADGKVCYGELKAQFEGGSTNTTTTIVSGKGKVVDKSATSGCGLMIALENGTYLIPAEMVQTFTLKAGQYIEVAYELLKDKPSTCPPGVMARIHKIGEIIQTTCNVPITFAKNNTAPVSYTFKTAEQPTGAKYYWYFGDQGTSTEASPTFTFSTTGTYNITLKVLDANGKACSNVLKAAFEGKTTPVLSAKGKVRKIALTGCDLVIALENSTTLIPAKIVPEFVLRDGQYVELTYEKLGEKITDCKEGFEAKILTIKEIPNTTPACKAYFTATNQLWSDPAMMKKVVFSNQSTGDIKEVLWNFGDNSTSTELKPTHEYAAFGEYKVCLVITTISGCKSDYCATVKVTNTIAPTGCKFDLVIKAKPETPNTYLYYAVSQAEIKTWKWNFGDGKTSDLKNPEHVYEKAGIYEVSCTVTTAAGCTETKVVKHTVLAAPLASCKGAISLMLFEPTNNCNGKAIVKLLDENAVELKDVKYIWSDGRTGSIAENLCPDKTYIVQAIIEGVCQKSTSFTMLSRPVWKAASINGQNNFSVVAPVEGVQYEWNFGDGKTLTGADVNYNFATDGVYNVTLKAVSGADVSEYSQQVVIMKSVTGTSLLVKSDIKVFPNPVSDELRINFGAPVDGNLLMEVMSITGQKVISRTLNTNGSSQAIVDVKSLQKGMYFMRLTNGRHLITDVKFNKSE